MIGLCCHYVKEKVKRDGTFDYVNQMDEKLLQFGQYNSGKYSKEKILDTWIHNITSFNNCLDAIINDGIRSLRVSSNLFPLFDKELELLESSDKVKNILKQAGDKLKSHNMRVTSHPSQFVVLSSLNDNVVDNSINQLKHHAWIFDSMGLDQTPYYSINIHGGVRNQKEKLIEVANSLPLNVKNRLTFENDELCYTVKDLYDVFEKTNVPVCFDSHYHSFNDSELPAEKAFELAKVTWGKIKPLTHLSNTEPDLKNGSFKDRRKHSEYVHYIPEYQRLQNNDGLIDIDFEFKQKNLAIKKAIVDFDIKL